MYIIYLYIIYILFISLVRLFKNSSPNGPPHVCSDLIVTCYLLPLIVKIAPAQGKCAPLLKEKNVSRCFAIPPQSRGDSTAIAPPSYANRRFRCFTRRAGSLLSRRKPTGERLQQLVNQSAVRK